MDGGRVDPLQADEMRNVKGCGREQGSKGANQTPPGLRGDQGGSLLSNRGLWDYLTKLIRRVRPNEPDSRR